MSQNDTFKDEVARGERFEFGKNWSDFLAYIDENRVYEAELSLKKGLGLDSLEGMTFLDIGCGSGLFSLAALNLGASVYSFDYDPNSVKCTRKLLREYGKNSDWRVERGSALDPQYIYSLPKFDIVYSWGVLHHTGDMWSGIQLMQSRVKDGGKAFLAIYNDQGFRSRLWKKLKKSYAKSPRVLKGSILWTCIILLETQYALVRLIQGKMPVSPDIIRNYSKQRGMKRWHNYKDWVGGHPFEVATPDEIFHHFNKAGFVLDYMTTCGSGHGCNEFGFIKRL